MSNAFLIQINIILLRIIMSKKNHKKQIQKNTNNKAKTNAFQSNNTSGSSTSDSRSKNSPTKVEYEEPPVVKTRREKVLSIFDKFGDLFTLNLCFILTCLPIFTIGASFVALYTVTNKMVNDLEGPVRQEYFKAFKANFKQGTQIWLIDLVYIFFAAAQYIFYLSNPDSPVSKYLFIFIGFEFILFAFAYPLQFPLAARYENTTFRIIFNSLVLSLAHLGTWFRMFFIWMFPVALYYLNPKIMVYTWYLWGLALTAIFAYVCSMLLSKFYETIENIEAENTRRAEEAKYKENYMQSAESEDDEELEETEEELDEDADDESEEAEEELDEDADDEESEEDEEETPDDNVEKLKNKLKKK